MKYATKKYFRKKRDKRISFILIVIFLFETGRPTLYAIGGPTQPETATFVPASADNLVDLFSGDFSYNIPLLEVDGYPLNIAYNAGITPEQEATWVGLGWSLNPGAITRDVQGIPDDFNGDELTYEKNINKNVTVGITSGLSFEILQQSGSLGVSAGVSYNNYQGFDLTTNAGITLGATVNGKFGLNGALSINNSSMNGITVSKSLGLDTRFSNEAQSQSLGMNLSASTSYNSRSGIQHISYGSGFQYDANKTVTRTNRAGYTQSQSISVPSSIGNVGTFGTIGIGYSIPRVNSDFVNTSFTGRFTLGTQLLFLHPNVEFNGFYSEQKLKDTFKTKKAFGFLNSGNVTDPRTDVMDFSRENEVGFSFSLPALPMAKMNPDILSVSGQGVSGSYKPYSNSFGVTVDSHGESTSSGLSLGVELGLGAVFHGGGNVQKNTVHGTTGSWVDGNNATSLLGFKNPEKGSFYENVYYVEANEKGQFVNESFYYSTGSDKAVRFKINKASSYKHKSSPSLRTVDGIEYPALNSLGAERAKRNSPMSMLTVGEVKGGAGTTDAYLSSAWSSAADASPDHIGEISVLSEDGKRFVYGLPVYNLTKREATFAVGTRQNGTAYPYSPQCETGYIKYNQGYNSTENTWGLDNYFSRETTPPYAHSYMATAILGADYIDADDIHGPSEGDLGEWVKFSYQKNEEPYKWRIPFASQANMANYDPGILSDKTDDKASYVYGEKELVYVSTIETRNYVVRFHTSDRSDGYGVLDENGGLNTEGAVMQRLDSIRMFTRMEFEASGDDGTPVKSVHFTYASPSQSLCQGVSSAQSGGKLTLTGVHFTYRNSKRAIYNPYKFEYNPENPDYHQQSTDRWGNYKAPVTGNNCDNNISLSDLRVPIFPYSEQEESLANQYAQSWNLKAIALPSGGRIEVEYEADRYRYVQHKEATSMRKIVSAISPGEILPATGAVSLIKDNNGYNAEGMEFGFELDGYSVSDYVSVGDLVYFRCLVQLGTGNESDRSDFISGYARVAEVREISGIGYVKFEDHHIDGIGDGNPVLMAALQFGRLHLSHMVYNSPLIDTDAGLTLQLIQSIINVVSNFSTMFTSPNKQIVNNNRAKVMFTDKSWLKLKIPGKTKYTTGHRVKEIRLYDNWDKATEELESAVCYGRSYSYHSPDGFTSGVASNEPLMGGEENALYKPFPVSTEDEATFLAPDNKYYLEEPFAKAFFPVPTVGYGRVEVHEFQMVGSSKTSAGTGHTVNEFFTAKDFPTIYDQTDNKVIHDGPKKLNFTSLFGHNVKDAITFSQGYMVETNDMHGKLKKVSIYAEGQNSPVQTTTYHYKSESYSWQGDTDTRRLVNDENTLITPAGYVLGNQPVGVFHDVLVDTKHERSESEIYTLPANLDGAILFVLPITLATAMSKKSKEITDFKYLSVTKTIQKFGILDKVVTNDQGTVSEERYLAFDSETGMPLVKQTRNNFNDSYYTISFPGYWGYRGMGPASVNVGAVAGPVIMNSSGIIMGNTSVLRDGDEVVMKSGVDYTRGWIVKNPNLGTRVIDAEGNFISGSFQYLKVYRSGNKNLLGNNMMEVVTLADPMSALISGAYTKVLSATGTEYGNVWRTVCDCFGADNSVSGLDLTNPYRMGARGMWRPVKGYTYLTNRTQTDYNENTNLRHDGVFASFNPLFERNGGNWLLNPESWTYTSEVIDYSPEGYVLETRDALGRYSATLYGYNRALQVAVAENSRRQEIGFDGFEDTEDASCGTDHMRFVGTYADVAHTGRKSILVSAGTPISISRDLQTCEPISSLSCNLVVDQNYGSGDTLFVTAGCYTPPLNITYENIQGNQTVIQSPEGLLIVGGNPGLVTVEFVDAAGCVFSEIIEFEPF